MRLGPYELLRELEVERVLKGQHDGALMVKTVAGYSVREGTKGAWLIDDTGTVLGRDGAGDESAGVA